MVDIIERRVCADLEGQSEDGAAVRRAQSDPQRQEPAETQGQPLRWLATPSVGAMLSLALLGIGVVAANRGRRRDLPAQAQAEQTLVP